MSSILPQAVESREHSIMGQRLGLAHSRAQPKGSPELFHVEPHFMLTRGEASSSRCSLDVFTLGYSPVLEEVKLRAPPQLRPFVLLLLHQGLARDSFGH